MTPCVIQNITHDTVCYTVHHTWHSVLYSTSHMTLCVHQIKKLLETYVNCDINLDFNIQARCTCSATAFQQLERQRDALRYWSAVKIQALWRCYICRCHWPSLKRRLRLEATGHTLTHRRRISEGWVQSMRSMMEKVTWKTRWRILLHFYFPLWLQRCIVMGQTE